MADLRIVLDTNVLWHGMLPSDHPAADICRGLVRASDDDDVEAYASTLTLVELPKVARGTLSMERIVVLTDALRRSNIRWVQLDEVIAMRARDLGLQHAVAKPYDAVMLATAVHVGARYLFTTDEDDFPVGETIDGVAVSVPLLPGHLAQGRLDTE